MVSKYSTYVLLMVLSTAFCLPTEVQDSKAAEKAEVIAHPNPTMELVVNITATEDAEMKRPEGEEKLMFPFLSLTAAMRPPSPPPAPAPLPTQTLVIPQGTPVAVNTNQPITVQQQGTTLITSQG